MNENGSYVTRAELKAHLDPMKEDIGEIKEGVQTLLLERAGHQALAKSKRLLSDRVIAWGALCAAVLSGAGIWLH